MNNNLNLPLKVQELIERAGISTAKQVLLMSTWDIQKLTNLNNNDIELLKNVAAQHYEPICQSGSSLFLKTLHRVKTGIPHLDLALNGGLRRGSLTEIYGESGSGKTQLAMQLSASNWEEGAIYICTEDLFPIKRFTQICSSLKNYNSDTNYGEKIFIEHITESDELLSCVRVRLKNLLDTKKIALVVIDSIAAPFRCENSNYVQRAEDMKELAMTLLYLAQKYSFAILCLNQVTASFDSEDVVPSLGLAWSNMVTARLWLKKTSQFVNLEQSKVPIRELSVVFAQDAPNTSVSLLISCRGVEAALDGL